MKKVLVFLLFFANLLFAIDKAGAIESVKNNPALLDTPQAQQLLKEKGLSKEQVLKKVNSLNKNSDIQTENNIKNKIDEKLTKSSENNNSINENNNSIKVVRKNTFINKPLSLISERKLVKLIQSKQQIIKKSSLKRFGEKFFYNKNTLNKQILSVPEYYQINVGDKIRVQIFGGNDKTLDLSVDNNGNISLPVIGPIYIAGLSVEEVKNLILKKLKPTYRSSKIVVNVKVNSFIQVALTGYVKAPGIYNLTSLSTVKDLLISSNGFGKLGSMREVYLKRNGKVLKIIDFYKLIKDGKLVDTTLLRNGDIIYVPKAKTLVNLRGAVSAPAIYEMKKNETLKDLINISGGLLPNASDKFIKIKRYVNNSYVKVLFKNLNDKFEFKNGDEIYTYKISELNQNYVKVYGNIEKVGTYELPKDKKLSTLLNKLSYLKNTYYEYGAITTFDNKIKSFSLRHPGNITLHKKDEIFIFNKYEALPLENVEVNGTAVRTPGKYRWYKGTTLKDVINSAGTLETANLKKVQIITYDKNFRPHLKYVDYTKNPNYKLNPFDEITIFDYYNFEPLKPITIFGAVHKSGSFIYAKGMTLKDALTMAGWIQDKADKNYIELIRYKVVDSQREREIKRLSLKDLDFKLQPYDEIYIKTIPNWNERKTVTIKGEVKYPGIYVIQKGDRLADIIKRAGGFTDESYLYGAVFARQSVRKMQEARLREMIYKLKKKVAILSASAKGAGENSLDAKNLMGAIDSVAIQAQNLKPIGRIAIKIDKNLGKFEKSPYNIVLENGDTLYIPSKKDSVIVMGEVLTPTAFVYTNDSALKYIKESGGENSLADNTYFVVHANGFTEKGEFGSWFDSDIKVKAGDAITVPIQIKTSTWYTIAKDMTSILYQLAITAASLKTVGAF
jgi:protein involved in polysaccharide export with SLBB domain